MKFLEKSGKTYVAIEDIISRHQELATEAIEGPGTSYHSDEQAWWDLKRELKKEMEASEE